jgi:hypothetical protein
MNMRKITCIIATLGFLLGNATSANSATFTFSGNLLYNNDIVKVGFTLANDSTNVKLWTDSFMATGEDKDGPGTNFDPVTALWDANTGELIDENDDNSDITTEQTAFDSGFSIDTLSAGNYFFTLASYENFAFGSNISDGLTYDAEEPILIRDWEQLGNEGNLRGTFWRLNLDGVDSASLIPTSAVPLPAAFWLFGSALISFAGFVRKKSLKQIAP